MEQYGQVVRLQPLVAEQELEGTGGLLEGAIAGSDTPEEPFAVGVDQLGAEVFAQGAIHVADRLETVAELLVEHLAVALASLKQLLVDGSGVVGVSLAEVDLGDAEERLGVTEVGPKDGEPVEVEAAIEDVVKVATAGMELVETVEVTDVEADESLLVLAAIAQFSGLLLAKLGQVAAELFAQCAPLHVRQVEHAEAEGILVGVAHKGGQAQYTVDKAVAVAVTEGRMARGERQEPVARLVEEGEALERSEGGVKHVDTLLLQLAIFTHPG